MESGLALARAVAGCGRRGDERQDENERAGDYPAEVTEAEFPDEQKLAKSSDLIIDPAQRRSDRRCPTSPSPWTA